MRRALCTAAVLLALAALASAQQVIATVTVGSSPALLSVNRATNLIYVANAGDSTVSVIDGASNSVSDTITVGSFPQAVSASQTDNRIYVGNFGSPEQLDEIVATSGQVLPFKVGSSGVITGLAANPRTHLVYMCVPSARLLVFNALIGHVEKKLRVPGCGFGLAVNSKTNRIYAPTFSSNVTVIDGSTHEIVHVFPTDLDAVVSASVDARSNHLAVVDVNAGKLEVLDGTTGKLLGTATGLNRPQGVVLIPGGKFALATESSSNMLAIVNTVTFSVDKRIPVGTFPIGVDFNGATDRAYVVNDSDNTVSVVQMTF